MKDTTPVDFIQLESVDSTNTWAKDHASSFNPLHLTCVIAKEQTAGRGRQNKKWISPKNVNLYISLYFTIPEGATYVANLGQVMILACAELLLEMRAAAQIKWPNDLLLDNQKIGGILTEITQIDSKMSVILGLGLNVNMPQDLLNKIDQPATSLHLFLKKKIDPLSLIQPLLSYFIPRLRQLQSVGFAPFQSRFQELLAFKGKEITLKLPQKKIRGICDSITSEGCLRLQLHSGQFLTLSIGEII